jgi:hypothetical protein
MLVAGQKSGVEPKKKRHKHPSLAAHLNAPNVAPKATFRPQQEFSASKAESS